MQQFAEGFKKQFQLQKSAQDVIHTKDFERGNSKCKTYKKKVTGRFVKDGPYYPLFSSKRGLQNNDWAMLTFINVAPKFGFNDEQIMKELSIDINFFSVLKEALPDILSANYHDKELRKTIISKSGLVVNHLRFMYR